MKSREETVPSPSATPTPRQTATEVVTCAVLALAPFLWRLASGTRRMPNDDTWAYERIFETYFETGRIVLIDWNDINLVGMLPLTRVWVAVVGYGPLQVHLLGAVVALGSLLVLRWILHRLESDRVLLSLVSFGVFGGFVATTGTYMADQFALAGSLVALALAVSLAQSPRASKWSYLVVLGAAVASVFAFTVRQQSAVAAVVVLGVVFAARRTVRHGWLLYAITYAVIAGGFHLWRSGLADGGATLIRFNGRFILAGWIVMLSTVSLVLLPLVWSRSRSYALVSPALRVAASVLAGLGAAMVDAGDFINDSLSIFQRLGDLPPVGRAVVGIVLVNVILTVAAAVIRRRPVLSDELAVALAAGVALALLAELAIIFLGSDYHSRYSMFLVALVLVTAAVTKPRSEPERPVPLRAWLAVAVIGASSYWALDGALTPLRLAQEAAEIAACAGIPPDELDAGIVWMGMHSTGVVVSDHWSQPWPDDGLPRTQHQRIFPNATRNAVLLDEPPESSDGFALVPVEVAALLPGNSRSGWLVVSADDAYALAACTED